MARVLPAAALFVGLTTLAAGAGARSVAGKRLAPAQPTGEPGMIDAVAISVDGRAVLSRDDQGRVLFWPSLDGKSEPRLVDVQSPDGLALAPRGGGFTLAIVDTAGGGHVFRAAADGTSRETGTMAPTDPLTLLRPIPGDGRVLALAADSTLRLYSESGKPLAKLEEREFHVTDLCVAADGKSALVTIEGESIQKLVIGKKKLTLEGEAARLPMEAGTTRFATACSPAADRYAFLRSGPLGTGEVEMVVAALDGSRIAKQTIPAQHAVSAIGFLDEDSLFLWAPGSSMSAWKYDLKKKELIARSGRPDALLTNPNEVVAGGRRVTGDGAWLFVDEVDAREQRYLGYQDFLPFMTAMSPGGVAAFADGMGNVLIEDLAGKDRSYLPSRNPGFGIIGIYFVDDDHLLVAEGTGVMNLVAWRTGKVVERAWTGFFGEATYEPSTRLFRISNANGMGETRVWEATAKGLVGPYVIADGGIMSGLVAADKPGAVALWTLDSNQVRREYTLAEIRDDLSLEEMTSRGKQANPDDVPPLFIDNHGRKYVLDSDEAGTRIDIMHAGKKQTIRPSTDDVLAVIPAPDGSAVALMDSAGGLSVYRPENSVRPMWAFSDPSGSGFMPAWSDDGKWLAVAGSTGALILDGKTGDVAYRRRVLGFEERQVLDTNNLRFIEGFGRIEPGILDI